MLDQDFLTAGIWDQHVLEIIDQEGSLLLFLCFGMEKRSHKSMALSIPTIYWRLFQHHYVWGHHSCGFQLQQRYILNVLTPFFLSRLIEVGRKMNHFTMSPMVPWKILSPCFENGKYKILNFLFWKLMLDIQGQKLPN